MSITRPFARFLREQPVPLHHVRYEDLVREPEAGMEAICGFAGLDFECIILAALQLRDPRGIDVEADRLCLPAERDGHR